MSRVCHITSWEWQFAFDTTHCAYETDSTYRDATSTYCPTVDETTEGTSVSTSCKSRLDVRSYFRPVFQRVRHFFIYRACVVRRLKAPSCRSPIMPMRRRSTCSIDARCKNRTSKTFRKLSKVVISYPIEYAFIFFSDITLTEQKDKQKKLIALMTQRQEKKEKKLLEQKDIDINVLSIELSSLKEENSKQQKQIVQMSEAIHLLKKSKKNQASDFQNRIEKLQSDIDSLKVYFHSFVFNSHISDLLWRPAPPLTRNKATITLERKKCWRRSCRRPWKRLNVSRYLVWQWVFCPFFDGTF